MTYRILIVEDDEDIAEFISETLIEGGYEIAAVCTRVADALAQLAATKPDLIILDIALGGSRDGVSLAQQLQGPGNPRIVFCTGALPKPLDDFVGLKSSGVLLKPFSQEHLLLTVSAALAEPNETGQRATF